MKNGHKIGFFPVKCCRHFLWFIPAIFLATLNLLIGGLARAEFVTKSNSGTDLADAASWDGSVPGTSDVAMWTTNSLGAGLTLQVPAYWGGMRVAGALSDIDLSGWGWIVLGAGGIDMSDSVVNMSVANYIVLDTNQTWNVNEGETLTLAEPISGSWNLVKEGAGKLILTANNPVTGMIIVNAGTLMISGQIHYSEGWRSIDALTINAGGTVTVASGDAANFLGQCNFDAAYNTIDGGTLQFDTSSGTAETVYRTFTIGTNGASLAVLNSNATLTFDYFGDWVQFSVPASASLTLTGEGNGVMNKNITGYGGLIKSGTGIWTLNGDIQCVGPTIISNGTLVVNGSLGVGPVTVAPGARLGGAGGIRGNLTFMPGAQVQFTLGAVPTWSGSLILNDNSVHLLLPVQTPPGNYLLATYHAPGSLGSFNLIPIIDSGSLDNGCSAQIKTDRGNVALVVLPPPAPHLAILSVNGGSNVTAGLGFSVMLVGTNSELELRGKLGDGMRKAA